MPEITLEAIVIASFIRKKWGRKFDIKLEVKLSDLFDEPTNPGLKHIWTYGCCDIVVYKNNKPIAVIEPGGGHHFEEKQMKNDRRKYKLCEINGVKCLHLMNGVIGKLSNRKVRSMFGSVLFHKDDKNEKG